MKLFEIVAKKKEINDALEIERIKFDAFVRVNVKKLCELNRLETMALDGVNIDYVQIAEKVIEVTGNPYGVTDSPDDGKTIAFCAIEDIATGCHSLKTRYFGNKRYCRFYQRCDCEYGFGPTHGSIVDMIALRNGGLELTDEEKEACIYYIKNRLYERNKK